MIDTLDDHKPDLVTRQEDGSYMLESHETPKLSARVERQIRRTVRVASNTLYSCHVHPSSQFRVKQSPVLGSINSENEPSVDYVS